MKRLNAFFKIEQRGSSVKTELVAGMTIFLTMVYILLVNASMMSELPGVSYQAVYIGTALTTVVATMVTGLLANLPLAQSVALGTNGYFIYSVCIGLGFTYGNALLITFCEGLIFVILSVTGIRQKMMLSIPEHIPDAITLGMAMFLSVQGLRNAGILQADGENMATITTYNFLREFSPEKMAEIGAFVGSLLVLIFLDRKKIKGAAFFSILAGTVLYDMQGLLSPSFFEGILSGTSMDPLDAFRAFFNGSFLKCFSEGFDFSGYLSIEGNSVFGLFMSLLFTTFAFCMLDMFSAIGTLTSVLQGNLQEVSTESESVSSSENAGIFGLLRGKTLDRAVLSDAIGTCTGALFGVSSVTTYLESVSAVRAGGKTGLTSLTVSFLFLLAAFLTPVSTLIPACAYAGTLFYIGAVMVKECVTELQENGGLTIPSLVIILIIALTCNIAYGFAIGMILEVLLMLVRGRGKTIQKSMWILFVCSLLLMFCTH